LIDCAETSNAIYDHSIMKKYDIYVMYDDYDNDIDSIEYLNENNEIVNYEKILKAKNVQNKHKSD